MRRIVLFPGYWASTSTALFPQLHHGQGAVCDAWHRTLPTCQPNQAEDQQGQNPPSIPCAYTSSPQQGFPAEGYACHQDQGPGRHPLMDGQPNVWGPVSHGTCHAWHIRQAVTAAWPACCSASVRSFSSGISRAATRSAPPDQQAEDDELALLASELLGAEQQANLTPTAIVKELDKYIVGQAEAKRAVAIALRNRWRRSLLPQLAADEVMPKNILMVGPTGVGKTEIARRLAKLADAPFVKVEATKYTELGYVGRDVEDIIKDLVEAAQSLVRQRLQRKAAEATAERVERIILNALVGDLADPQTKANFRDLYRSGLLDDNTVPLALPSSSSDSARHITVEGGQFVVFDQKSPQASKQNIKVSEARQRLEDAEVDKMMGTEQVTREAIRAAEQDGIVFIDEIDKIVESGNRMYSSTGSISGSGVQRDLLPIIEGSSVPTKYGNVNTDHILFICAGAFHSAKPQDMMAELQGRLPIRVALQGLTSKDFVRILTEPENNMLMQQQALLATEGVKLTFTDDAVRAIAQVAEEVNLMLDNIGARRLHTVLERILSDISYSAPERAAAAKRAGQSEYEYVVDKEYVHSVMKEVLQKRDLSRYVL